LADRTQQHNSLLTSEILLLQIPRAKFNADSWQICDEFMNFAVELISSTFVSLISSGYLFILEKERKPFKALNLTIWTNEKYLIKLQEKPREAEFTGWFEDKIFKQFTFSNSCYLDKIVYNVLNDILNKNHNHINPGKVFLLEIVKNQKLNILKFNQTTKWFSNYITIALNNNLETNFKKHQLRTDNLNLMDNEILFIKKTVKKQLNKFQNLD